MPWMLFTAYSRAYFLRQEYGKAIGPYQKALDQEKTTPKLDVPKWRILIDNLATAYGINGKLDPADEILKYGISKDPNYPMFYFLMADSSAERNDFDNTMKFFGSLLGSGATQTPARGCQTHS